ncbi:hypothetical protein CRH09_39915 (plasmid) [Nocardia terpenica]|uniref:Uncharacterized protein n=1 Tax=Nocardia terpenica TaxID=455432 RepID=A0A291RZ04_9NOCA|nr:hypothetical protein CRH09_39915 [Nocardia terpenica]
MAAPAAPPASAPGMPSAAAPIAAPAAAPIAVPATPEVTVPTTGTGTTVPTAAPAIPPIVPPINPPPTAPTTASGTPTVVAPTAKPETPPSTMAADIRSARSALMPVDCMNALVPRCMSAIWPLIFHAASTGTQSGRGIVASPRPSLSGAGGTITFGGATGSGACRLGRSCVKLGAGAGRVCDPPLPPLEWLGGLRYSLGAYVGGSGIRSPTGECCSGRGGGVGAVDTPG